MENVEENYLKIIERLNELEKAEKETQEVLAKILIEIEKKERNSNEGSPKKEVSAVNKEDFDSFFIEAAEAVINVGAASTSFIQRKFKVGYARSSRILDQLEEEGIISMYHSAKPRDILMTKEEFEELKKTKYSNLIKN